MLEGTVRWKWRGAARRERGCFLFTPVPTFTLLCSSEVLLKPGEGLTECCEQQGHMGPHHLSPSASLEQNVMQAAGNRGRKANGRSAHRTGQKGRTLVGGSCISPSLPLASFLWILAEVAEAHLELKPGRWMDSRGSHHILAPSHPCPPAGSWVLWLLLQSLWVPL